MGGSLLVRWIILAFHSLPHASPPHFHGTISRALGQKSSGLIVGWFHSTSRCASRPPLSSQVSFRLCVAVGTEPAHAGHPLGCFLVRSITRARHSCPQSLQCQRTFWFDALVTPTASSPYQPTPPAASPRAPRSPHTTPQSCKSGSDLGSSSQADTTPPPREGRRCGPRAPSR
jgi:hypothetical protein